MKLLVAVVALAVVVIPLQGQGNRRQLEFQGGYMRFVEPPRNFEDRDVVVVLTNDDRLQVWSTQYSRRGLRPSVRRGLAETDLYVDIPLSSIYKIDPLFGNDFTSRIFYEHDGVRDYVIVAQEDLRLFVFFITELELRLPSLFSAALAGIH